MSETSVPSRSPFRPGDLVFSTENDLGPGKAVRRSADGLIEVEYFDHVGQSPEARHREQVALATLRRVRLEPETRVYWQTENGGWLSGEILTADPQRRFVIVEQYRRLDHNLREPQLYVRWNRPLIDILGLALARSFASPLFVQLRQPFLNHMLLQRAAVRGSASILSSAIEHHAHQLRIARRILSDPIQRYLLADEVGLGKTVEAGLVLRQLLLDDPSRKVLVIAPEHLRDQWRDELASKFLTRDFRESAIAIASQDDPASWTSSDLLIVDEAHHTAQWCGHPQHDLASRYQILAELTKATPRLLLLSATPLLHNEQTFLAMLHLIDADIYPLDELEEFQARIAARWPLGLLVHALAPGAPGFLLRRKLPELRGLFPSDRLLAARIDQAEAALASGDLGATESAVSRVRAHVSEVHRLHRRMLRTRRTPALASTFPLAGRHSPVPHYIDSESAVRLDQVVEEWRQAMAGTVDGESMEMQRAGADLFAALVEAAVDIDSLEAFALWRQASREAPLLSSDEVEVLNRMKTLRHYIRPTWSRASEVLNSVITNVGTHERCVVFSSGTHLATMVFESLARHMGRREVSVHLAGQDPADQRDALRAFDLRRARILVCDRSAEEGLNLQFADVVVHADIPTNPNRLEQRIGRTDRWRRGAGAVRSVIVADPADSETLWDVWYSVLDQGFGVFTQSIATLQHVVDAETRNAWLVMLKEGRDASTALIRSIRSSLDEERDHVAQLDALDIIEADDDDQVFTSEVAASESLAPLFGQISDRLLVRDGQAGNLRFHRDGDPVDGVGFYALSPSGQRTNTDQLPAIPADRVRRDLAGVAGRPATFERSVAVEMPGIRLYRYGEPMMDAIADFLWHDDRGRLWAIWRYVPGWDRDDAVFFGIDFQAKASGAATESVRKNWQRWALDARAVQRRLDDFLPPQLTTVWVDSDVGRVTDVNILEILDRPFIPDATDEKDEGGDYHLSPDRQWALEPFLPSDNWNSTWRRVFEGCSLLARENLDLVERCRRATERAEHLGLQRIQQLELRAAYATGETALRADYEADLERSLFQALLSDINDPLLLVDASRLVVVSARMPFDPELTVEEEAVR